MTNLITEKVKPVMGRIGPLASHRYLNLKTIMIKNNRIFKSNIIPKSQIDLGYYLAGLIEGDGHFSKKQLIISGHQSDYEFFNYVLC
jgi:hypothetical protein